LFKNTYEFFDIDCLIFQLIVLAEFTYRSWHGQGRGDEDNDLEEADLQKG
jgi:hypothetical protein